VVFEAWAFSATALRGTEVGCCSNNTVRAHMHTQHADTHVAANSQNVSVS
jgi:hypothetical protein